MDKVIGMDNEIVQQLSEDQLKEVQGFFNYDTYKKGSFIIKANEKVKYLYFIRSGLVKLSYEDEHAREHILSFAFEGWWETDFAAFYQQVPAKLSLQCLEDTALFKLSYDDYHHVVQEYGLSNYFLQKSINGHMANQNRILSLLTDNPKARYEYFLHVYPSLAQRISKTILAQYLGVSRETLSRIYKK